MLDADSNYAIYVYPCWTCVIRDNQLTWQILPIRLTQPDPEWRGRPGIIRVEFDVRAIF